MTDLLSRLLDERRWLLADGATGTNLYNMGLAPGDVPDLWCETHPDRVLDLHCQMIQAGADVILTNSFGANASRLRLAHAETRVAQINHAAARIAREAADKAGRPVIVAGSIGPTGQIMAPVGHLTEAEATRLFTEQALALKDGGADILWIETVSAIEEMRAASRAAEAAGLPWCGMMSFESGGRSMMGVSPPQLAKLIDRLPCSPVAYGANCGTGPAELLLAVAGFAAAGCERPLIAKPNAGVPRYQDGGLVYDATPEVMAEFAVLARDLGVRIIGGCCGTTPAHLSAMRAALQDRPPGPRPSSDAISSRIELLMNR
ncbi:betaine--homocysteine S-methyltransferase [Paracoccus shanxieyensis]|uniref:Betaine--homocysteine S-methyltransferase n=1 Tax=Paracoccus shanxieyensis TaxID=2675752 RepID=A0A6L6IZE8_9RHOB|nr:betaine--homocysteine S-methyltransferase [Paracoccus shanxieyensis]MTH63787.1 betaine--homocysteine S-methyltransferase [Paracoccus shanxieyensis]MTH86702.1 betaine--homocysteine S-methyltransferase [Paracoccus shanxieyensis]